MKAMNVKQGEFLDFDQIRYLHMNDLCFNEFPTALG